jgi:chondroitin AC lyase
LAVEQEKLDIIAGLVNNGYRRILWKGFMDVNALDRQLFRQAQPHKAFSVAFSSKALADVDIVNRNRYSSLLNENFKIRSNPEMTGVYHFWKSDQTVCRKPEWMASVKMSSYRVIGAEAGNGDNMKGYYMADGATFTYIDGDEYTNIFPTWDWRKIPGITSYETDAPLNVLTWEGYRNGSHFVGNVNNGNTGLTCMQFNRDGLKASKSWIFTDNYILCLGAGITSSADSAITTSVDQRLKKSDLLYLNKNKWEKIEQSDILNSKDTRFFHDNMGYIILSGDKISARDETRVGYWKEVMQMYPKDMTEENQVISLWLDHGKKPGNASYQYIILPLTTPEQIKSFNIGDIQIISNDKNSQIVFLPKEKTIFIAVYEALDIKLPLNIRFETQHPGLFMIKSDQNGRPEITVSDPTQQLDFIDLKINGKEYRTSLPSGELAGTSVTFK